MEYSKFVTLLRFLNIGEEYKPRGDNVTIRCVNPDHQDNSPSCSVNYKKGIFHCFSCGISGNLTTLVKLKMKLQTKEEAFKILQNLGLLSSVNADLKNDDIVNKYSKLHKQEENDNHIDVKFPTDINLIEKGDYHYNYISESSPIGRDIFNVDELIHKFKLRKNKFRLFVPILDEDSKLVGYGNRTITDQSFLNKYPIIDKPEQPKILYPYGFSLTRYIYNFNNIKDKDCLILVEGMFDVFNVWDKGFENVGATFSNKMSETQAKLITKHFQGKKVMLLVDRDSQGMVLVNHAYQHLFGKVDLNICLIPVGKDPGECNKLELGDALNNPIPIMNFIGLRGNVKCN